MEDHAHGLGAVMSLCLIKQSSMSCVYGALYHKHSRCTSVQQEHEKRCEIEDSQLMEKIHNVTERRALEKKKVSQV